MNGHGEMRHLGCQSGFDAIAEWHRTLSDRIYDPSCSFRPVIFATDTDAEPPQNHLDAVLVTPDEALQAFLEHRASGQLPQLEAIAQILVEPFDQELVGKRFSRDPNRAWFWTSLMARNSRLPCEAI